ncbi:MAG TPA: hypothetical protein VK202_09090 [Bacteroidia bacterium]|nr:hypothetical protein [Bacteroidia bacterium]
MSRIAFHRFRAVDQLISAYSGEQPFHLYLSEHFKRNKQIGSKDRKALRNLCYAYLRLGKAKADWSFQLRFYIALFLVNDAPDEMTDYLSLETGYQYTAEDFALPIQSKLNKLNIEEAELFPWMEQLSNLPDKSAYVQSLLHQPLVWLRLSSSSFEKAKQLLQEHAVPYEVADDNPRCVGVPSATPLDKLTTETWWEIQDYSSQRVLDKVDLANAHKVWDCCAASGGKSLLLKEKLNEADLYVSDVRENILLNLHHRFQRNHIVRYHYSSIDLMQESSHLLFTQKGTGKQTQVNSGYFDTIVADVPCTGSGTWARTPEQWAFFDAAKIDTYATKQRTILKQILPFLSSGGQLIYITCSVFAAENELQVAYMEKELGLKVESSSMLQGSSLKADTMFVAVLKKI